VFPQSYDGGATHLTKRLIRKYAIKEIIALGITPYANITNSRLLSGPQLQGGVPQSHSTFNFILNPMMNAIISNITKITIGNHADFTKFLNVIILQNGLSI